MIFPLTNYFIIILAFVVSMVISTLSIKIGIPWLKRAISRSENQIPQTSNRLPLWKGIGFWIGLFETMIIFVFVLNREFGGLAIIFGAKEFVRKEEITKDPTYYLLGTLVNFGISLVVLQIALNIIPLLSNS